MTSYKIKPIVQGAMIAAIYGVLAIVNVYTGSLFDVIFSYVMVLPMSWYAREYSLKQSVSLLLVSGVVLFLAGQLFFTFFGTSSLVMGIYYGESLKRNWSSKRTYLGLLLISTIKNFFVFFVFGSLLGVSIFKEGLEMHQELIAILPILKNVISPEISFVFFWIIIFVSEAYIVKVYSNLFLNRIIKKK